TPQLHDFSDHLIDGALPRLLAVGAPHRTERTVLWTAAHRLDRRPHVAALREQIPSGRREVGAADTAAFIQRLRMPRDAVADDLLPHQIAVAADHRMRLAVRAGFVGEQRRVNAAVDDPRAACARLASD